MSDGLYMRDTQVILKALRSGQEVPLPADRQIAVISKVLENSKEYTATNTLQQGCNILKRQLKKLQEKLQQQEPTDSTAPAGQIQIIMVDPREIKDKNLNEGIFKDLPEDELQELASSMKNRAIGVLNAVIITPRKELIVGKQRLRAALLADLDKIPAIVRDADEDLQLEICLSENLFRRDLTPKEAYTARSTLEALKKPKSQKLLPQNAVDDLELQNVLENLPPDIQNKLGHALGTKIAQLQNAMTRDDALHIVKIKQQLAAEHKEKEKLTEQIGRLVEELKTREEEKDEIERELAQVKGQSTKEVSDLTWEINNLRATLKRLQEENEHATDKIVQLRAKYESVTLTKIEKEVKVLVKTPEDYEGLKRDLQEMKQRSKVRETFMAHKIASMNILKDLKELLAQKTVTKYWQEVSEDAGQLSGLLIEVNTILADITQKHTLAYRPANERKVISLTGSETPSQVKT